MDAKGNGRTSLKEPLRFKGDSLGDKTFRISTGAFFAKGAAAFITLASVTAVGGAEAPTGRDDGVWSSGFPGFTLPLARGAGASPPILLCSKFSTAGAFLTSAGVSSFLAS